MDIVQMGFGKGLLMQSIFVIDALEISWTNLARMSKGRIAKMAQTYKYSEEVVNDCWDFVSVLRRMTMLNFGPGNLIL